MKKKKRKKEINKTCNCAALNAIDDFYSYLKTTFIAVSK